METVRSSDGTTIAYDRLGQGPAVVIVAGGNCERGTNSELAQFLAADHTVLNYDRRGRGGSTDTLPYTPEREIDDLEAIIEAAGGSAAVVGFSSGAILALHAAAAGLPITKLALFEPPFQIDADASHRWQAYCTELTELLEAGRRGDATALFLATVGLPEEMIAGMRRGPMWPPMEAIAHTLAYDASIMGDGRVPAEQASSVRIPTLVLDSTDTGPWAERAALAVLEMLPDGRRRTLEGQYHMVSAQVLAPALNEFLAL